MAATTVANRLVALVRGIWKQKGGPVDSSIESSQVTGRLAQKKLLVLATWSLLLDKYPYWIPNQCWPDSQEHDPCVPMLDFCRACNSVKRGALLASWLTLVNRRINHSSGIDQGPLRRWERCARLSAIGNVPTTRQARSRPANIQSDGSEVPNEMEDGACRISTRGREVEADHEMKSISGGSTRWCDWNGHHLVTLQVDAPGAPNVQTCRVQSSSRTD